MNRRFMIGLFAIALVTGQSSDAAAQTTIENRDILSPAAREHYREQMGSLKLPDETDQQKSKTNAPSVRRSGSGEAQRNSGEGNQIPDKDQ